jgi:hypothetical protein
LKSLHPAAPTRFNPHRVISQFRSQTKGKNIYESFFLLLIFPFHSLFSDLTSLAGTTLLSLLATLFMSQLLFVIGVGGIQVLNLYPLNVETSD